MFADMAALVATRSHCSKLHVGCVVTDERGMKVAVGYNGGASGLENECEPGPDGRCPCAHAEANALIKVRFEGPLVLYSTHGPCETCAILAVNAGVAEAHYAEDHKDSPGVGVFMRAGVRVFRGGVPFANPLLPVYPGAVPYEDEP
jgi:dCMP deaminase